MHFYSPKFNSCFESILKGTVGAMTGDHINPGTRTIGVAIRSQSGTITISGTTTLITSANATATAGTILLEGSGNLTASGGEKNL